jgi:thiamine-monophosphate kinase
MKKNPQLAQKGELKLLKKVRDRFRTCSDKERIIVGIGDDAAVIAPSDKKIVVTTDMMNEGVHFDLGFTSAVQLGFKLISVNVSDVMSMGCAPKFIFLDLGFTREADEELFDGIYDGIDQALGYYGGDLLGGDLCSSRGDTILVATVIGEGDKVVYRKGAAPGDGIYVTSSTGDSGCGLRILKWLDAASRERVKGLPVFCGPEDMCKEPLRLVTPDGPAELAWDQGIRLIMRHLAPLARDSRDIAPHATAMLDISDGLFLDLGRMCDESGVGAVLYSGRIPVSDELAYVSGRLGMDAFQLAVSGGEDYELLFAARDFPLDAYNASHDIKVSRIGEITEAERSLVDEKGGRSPLTAAGYEHFGA